MHPSPTRPSHASRPFSPLIPFVPLFLLRGCTRLLLPRTCFAVQCAACMQVLNTGSCRNIGHFPPRQGNSGGSAIYHTFSAKKTDHNKDPSLSEQMKRTPTAVSLAVPKVGPASLQNKDLRLATYSAAATGVDVAAS